jgi:transposase
MRTDGRSLSHETLEEMRFRAIEAVKAGQRPSAIMKALGLCRTTIYRWIRAHKKGGEQALLSSRHPGPPPKLSAKQKRQVGRWINGKDPRQYGFDFGLWTRRIVADLIKQRFGVDLGVTAVGRLLSELGITPQKPLRRAYERDPVAIARWKTEEYPRLRARAKSEGADIFFLDEAGVRSDQVLGRTWAPRGKTPEVPTSGQRQSVNAISAVNALGAFWFFVYSGMFNATRFVEFLKLFMKGRRRKVFLVLDGHPSHRAKMVFKYIESVAGKLELHFLPGYAPELNPDEFVWNHLKRQGTSKKPLKKGESLRCRVEEDLSAIKRRPALVRAFFRAPSVAYTAD